MAFDVMKDVAKLQSFCENIAVITTLLMFSFTIYRANIMLKHDGFTPLQRLQMNLKDCPGFGRNGKLTRMGTQYQDWFKKISTFPASGNCPI